jgi:hypothetical protein
VNLLGPIQCSVKAADANYALQSLVLVDKIGDEEDEFEIDVNGGLLTAAMVGEEYDLDATGLLLDTTASTKKQMKVRKFLTASKAIVTFNRNNIVR